MKMPGFFEPSECVIKSPFRAHEDGVPWSVKYPSMLQLLGKLYGGGGGHPRGGHVATVAKSLTIFRMDASSDLVADLIDRLQHGVLYVLESGPCRPSRAIPSRMTFACA